MNYLLILIACLTSSPSGEESEQRMFATDGSESVVEVVTIADSSTQVIALGESDSVATDSINVIQFSAQPSARKDGLQLRLVDGSIVNAENLIVNNESVAELLAGSVTKQKINTRNIDCVALTPVTPDMSSQWQELLQSAERDTDWLIFDRGGALDYIEGIAGTVSPESVSFTTDDRTAEAPRKRVTGIAYFHATGRTFVDPVAILSTVDGSRLSLRSLRRGDARQNEDPRLFIAQTVCGAEFGFLPQEIFKIDFSAVRFQYLSNIVPSTIEWNPIFYNESIYEYQAMLNGPRFNQGYSNQPLSLDFPRSAVEGDSVQRVEYEHGIAIKGGTRLVFQLDGRFSRLQGLLGFSPEAPQDGLVECVLTADGKDLLRKVIDNRVDVPEQLDLDVRNVSRLTLQVNYHDGRNIGDIIHFCDAKVSR